jgi:hypothetical protein
MPDPDMTRYEMKAYFEAVFAQRMLKAALVEIRDFAQLMIESGEGSLSDAEHIELIADRALGKCAPAARSGPATNTTPKENTVNPNPSEHPHAPDRCPDCNWSNTGLLNYGVVGESRWLCHGCAARKLQEAERMRPVVEAAHAWAEATMGSLFSGGGGPISECEQRLYGACRATRNTP